MIPLFRLGQGVCWSISRVLCLLLVLLGLLVLLLEGAWDTLDTEIEKRRKRVPSYWNRELDARVDREKEISDPEK